MPSDEPTPLRFLREFDGPELRHLVRSRSKGGRPCRAHFEGPGLRDRLVRALLEAQALPVKELIEAFEFFAVVRKHLKTPRILDLCAGHGLAGLLFAVFERRVEEVVLFDAVRPPSFDAVREAVGRAAPWAADKARYVEGSLKRPPAELTGGAVLAVHACGALTDRCLDLAIDGRLPVAAMPCCRSHARNSAPKALRLALGEDVARDVDRTYRLEAAGYFVRWREISSRVTPENRVLIGIPQP